MEGIESRLDWISMDQNAFHNELIGLNPRVWNIGKFSSWGIHCWQILFHIWLIAISHLTKFQTYIIYTRIWHMHYTAYIHTYIQTPTPTHMLSRSIQYTGMACTMKSRVWVWRKRLTYYIWIDSALHKRMRFRIELSLSANYGVTNIHRLQIHAAFWIRSMKHLRLPAGMGKIDGGILHYVIGDWNSMLVFRQKVFYPIGK